MRMAKLGYKYAWLYSLLSFFAFSALALVMLFAFHSLMLTLCFLCAALPIAMFTYIGARYSYIRINTKQSRGEILREASKDLLLFLLKVVSGPVFFFCMVPVAIFLFFSYGLVPLLVTIIGSAVVFVGLKFLVRILDARNDKIHGVKEVSQNQPTNEQMRQREHINEQYDDNKRQKPQNEHDGDYIARLKRMLKSFGEGDRTSSLNELSSIIKVNDEGKRAMIIAHLRNDHDACGKFNDILKYHFDQCGVSIKNEEVNIDHNTVKHKLHDLCKIINLCLMYKDVINQFELQTIAQQVRDGVCEILEAQPDDPSFDTSKINELNNILGLVSVEKIPSSLLQDAASRNAHGNIVANEPE